MQRPGVGARLPRYEPDVAWDPQVQAYLEQCFGAPHFASMRAALSQPPKHTCLRVNTLEVMQVIQDASKPAAKEEQQQAYQAGRSP
ncbi:uncharacterized protein HaLaN_05398, partial [Haematococcus lacustris]